VHQLHQVNADLSNQERQTAVAKQYLYTSRLNFEEEIYRSQQESQN
jgi:hypothetical protein